jgi:zinc protease
MKALPTLGWLQLGMRKAVPLVLAMGLFFSAGASEAPKKIFPYEYDQHDFPNGLRLITVPTEFPNVVALYTVVQTGSRNEVEPGKSGFAHFFEHMMFRGTKRFPPERYEEMLKRAGADSNAYTSADLTAYHIVFSKEDLEDMLMIEADRFQNLDYSEAAFRTEALAVLGEYNKNSASPVSRIFETLQNKAFDKHTYKHTTMGFLADIQDMPNQFEYSKEFFGRWYRPEYTTVLVAGDVDPANVRTLVAKYWGNWKRGEYKAEVPVEPPQNGARSAHIDWPSPTLPWLTVAFKAPAYTDANKESAALDLLSFLALSDFSPLYRKLVIEEQKVDALYGGYPDRVDPYLFYAMARVKKQADMESVREDILNALNGFKDTPIDADRLRQVKSHLRYQVSLQMDTSAAIAARLANYIALRRTPETMNRLYEIYDQVTPEDIRAAARKYLVEQGRTIVTLSGGAQ